MPGPLAVKTKSVADSPIKISKVVEQYRAWIQTQPAADLTNPANGFIEGQFPTGFFNSPERYVALSSVMDRVNAEADIVHLDMGEVPDLITRVLLLDAHCLTPTVVERAFPAGVNMSVFDLKSNSWKKTLSRVQDDGLRTLRDRAMFLAGYFIMNDNSFTQVETKSKAQISLWFSAKITRSAIVYLLSYWRDAINFPMLVQATNGNTGNNTLNGNHDPWQEGYTVQEQTIASRVFHILKLKCVEMVTSAWLYMLDNTDDEIKAFPVSKEMSTGAVAAFKSARKHLDQTKPWWTPAEDWPVHADMRFRKQKTAGVDI